MSSKSKSKGKSKSGKSKSGKKTSSKSLGAGLSDMSFKRLAGRAGALRMTKELYVASRELMQADLDSFCRKLAALTIHGHRNTVKPSDVISVARLCGHPLIAGFAVKTPKSEKAKKRKEAESPSKSKSSRGGASKKSGGKTRKSRNGTKSLKAIKRIQKGSGFLIRKLPFQRLIKADVNKHADDLNSIASSHFAKQAEELRIAGIAKTYIQVYFESLYVEFFSHALNVALVSKRLAIKKRDLDVVREIQHLPMSS